MPRECEFTFNNNTQIPLIRIDDGRRNGYWDENNKWKSPLARVSDWGGFRIPLREKETPGIMATVTYKFDFSGFAHQQVIPEHRLELVFNSAEDGDGPNIVKARVFSLVQTFDPYGVISVVCETGRAPGGILPLSIHLGINTESVRSRPMKIERISLADPTRPLFPLVDENGLSPHFRTSDQPLWTVEKGTISASVSITSGSTIHIDVVVRAHPWVHLTVKTIEGVLRLINGKFGKVTIEGTIATIVHAQTLDLVTYRLPVKLPIPDAQAITSPWGFSKEVTWEMYIPTSMGSSIIVQLNPTPLELYAVSPWLHPSLAKEGVPLQLLRFVLLPILDLPQFPVDFAAYVTERVHKDTGFIYDTFHGSTSYMDSDGQFKLHSWLRDFADLHNAGTSDAGKFSDYKKYPPTVNCYDQAGILGFCIGLGFPDETSSKQLYRAFMRPYGFIKPTRLVGWLDRETNNPFFRGQKEVASLPFDDERRDPFGNHMFILYRNKALDACAGPHCGDETLAKYIENAIDVRHKEKIYNSDNKLIVRVDGCTGDVKIRPVLARHDEMNTTINPIEHVRRIYHHFLISQTAAADKNHFYIPLGELTEYLKTHLPSQAFSSASGMLKEISNTDGVIEPDSNGVRYGGFITYSMNYTYKGIAYPVDIDWHVCLSSKEALKVLAQVTSNSTAHATGFKEEIVDGHSFYSTPRADWENLLGRTAFSYGPHAVVLDSRIGTDALVFVAKAALAFIKENEGKDTTNAAFLSQNNDPDEMIPDESVTMKQGEVYTWTTNVTGFMDCDWEYDVGNVFLLDHKLSKTDKSQFFFYGRSQGCDAVVLTFTNQYMQQVTKRIIFQVD